MIEELKNKQGADSGYRDPTVSDTAADVLGRIGPVTIPRLLEVLKGENTQARAGAARALRKIGPVASVAAVSTLINTLRDGVEIERHSAAAALGNIGPAAIAAVPELTRALMDGDDQVRDEAAKALGQIRPNTEMP